MRTKSESMPAQLLWKDLCNLICMKECYFQTKLFIVRTDWKLHVKVQNDIKLRLQARHEHADSKRGCTSDLKHAGAIIDDANDAEDADAPDFAVGGNKPTASPGGIEPRPNCL